MEINKYTLYEISHTLLIPPAVNGRDGFYRIQHVQYFSAIGFPLVRLNN